MKTSVWDILTGVVMLGILCMVGYFVLIAVNPNSGLNLFPPGGAQPAVATRIVLPSPTDTQPGLPPTWTPEPPTPEPTKAVVGPSGLRPSSTPIPTNTVLVLPTFTPSRTPRTGIGGGTCSVVLQEPKDNTKMKAGQTFDMHWSIKNTSTDPWRADSVDIRFVSGERMHSGNDLRDFPYDVAPGGMLDLVIPMTAPNAGGSYVSNWQFSAGDKAYCKFYVTISVP